MTGCNLNCNYCDTEYAKHDGENFSIDDVISKIAQYNCKLVEITGGEPLLQEDIFSLVDVLLKNGYNILVETNGSQSIENLPKKVIKIIDWKTPGSDVGNSFDINNLDFITKDDEIKFVVSNREDFLWCKDKIKQNNLTNICKVLMSTVNGKLDPAELCEWIIEENLDIKFQLQLHKYIWPNDEKGR